MEASKEKAFTSSPNPEQPVLRLRGHPKPKSLRRAGETRTYPEVPVPTRSFWEQMELPLDFRCSEESACYALSCRAPGLRTQDVQLNLSSDSNRLIVSGLHLPTSAAVREMQSRITEHCVSTLDPEHIQGLYANMGAGKFGSFSQAFQIPRDVDVARIEAFCERGFLHVKLPKHVRRTRPAQSSLFADHSFLW